MVQLGLLCALHAEDQKLGFQESGFQASARAGFICPSALKEKHMTGSGTDLVQAEQACPKPRCDSGGQSRPGAHGIHPITTATTEKKPRRSLQKVNKTVWKQT